MNEETLRQLVAATDECKERLGNQFHIYNVDTSSSELNGNAKATAELVADHVLTIIEEQLDEEILYVSKNEIKSYFLDTICLNKVAAASLEELFISKGSYRPRESVENNPNLVQALPVVIIRKKGGEVLRLRRKEKSSNNSLHEKLVIWAGGHVRKEDAIEGHPLTQCAVRELQEELRLSVDVADLKLLGAIHSDSGGRTSRHVAVVYEWQADTEDIALVLNSSEFFEAIGTSLSGKFISLDELATEINSDKKNDKQYEVWSTEIARQLLPTANVQYEPRLDLF